MNPVSGNAEWASALEELRPYLMRFARSKINDVHAAEDLVQETLLVALTGRNPFQGKSALRTWLTSILYFKIVDKYRAQAQENVSRTPRDWDDRDVADLQDELQSKASHEASSGFDDPCREMERRQMAGQLMAAVRDLPARQRDVFVLMQMHGYSGAEVAAAAGLSLSNVWVILHRARKMLQAQLQGVYQ